MLVLLSSTPWYGAPRDNSASAAEVRRTVERVEEADRRAGGGTGGGGRVSLVTAAWKTEGEQRQFGNEMLRKMPAPAGEDEGAGAGAGAGARFTHALIVDADEVSKGPL